MTPLLDHPVWRLLVPHLVVSGEHSRGLNGPRHRIEVRPTAPSAVESIIVPCVACGQPIFPVRSRKGSKTARFVSVTCTLDVNVACARGAAARAATNAVRDAVQAYHAARRLPL